MERPFAIDVYAYNFDKVLHFIEYSILGFLLIRGISGSNDNISFKKALIMTFIIGTFCGFTDELHQAVVPGRYATFADFTFDSIGVFAGAVMFSVAQKRGMIYGKNTAV